MSAKNKLSYDHQEPAFLRRLRGEITSDRDTDRHERQIARPKRAKANDEDDGPTYVLDESSETLSKAEYEALVSGKMAEKPTDEGSKEVKDDEAKAQTNAGEAGVGEKTAAIKQHVQEVGKGSKKRKAMKIGGDDEDEEVVEEKKAPSGKKPKKKAKAVALSFGDE